MYSDFLYLLYNSTTVHLQTKWYYLSHELIREFLSL